MCICKSKLNLVVTATAMRMNHATRLEVICREMTFSRLQVLGMHAEEASLKGRLEAMREEVEWHVQRLDTVRVEAAQAEEIAKAETEEREAASMMLEHTIGVLRGEWEEASRALHGVLERAERRAGDVEALVGEAEKLEGKVEVARRAEEELDGRVRRLERVAKELEQQMGDKVMNQTIFQKLEWAEILFLRTALGHHLPDLT
jgi:predicted  nucleic acid-binding Zn-ribbon protein